MINDDYAMESGYNLSVPYAKSGRESSAGAIKPNAGISNGMPSLAALTWQIRSVLSNNQYLSPSAFYKKETALNRAKEEFDG